MVIIVIVINILLGRVTRHPAGMHCPCLFVFCWSRSGSGAPCVREVRSSNKHCVAVYGPIWTRFSAFFSTSDCSFTYTLYFLYSSPDGPTVFANFRSKLRKVQKWSRKCVHHFVQIAEGFEKKFYNGSLRPRL